MVTYWYSELFWKFIITKVIRRSLETSNNLLLFYLNIEYNCFQASKDEVSDSKHFVLVHNNELKYI